MGRISRDDMITIRKKLDEKYEDPVKVKTVLGIISYNYALGLSQSELKAAVESEAGGIASTDGDALSLIVAIIF